mgnify:CR=1 FL=1
MEELIKGLQSFDPGVPDPSEFMDCKWHPPKGHMEGFVFTDEMRRKMSVAAKKREPFFLGKTHTKEVRNKLSKLYKGKPFVGEHNNHKGTKWWNDGQINKRSVECPGKDFVPGRIPLGPYKRR